ALQRAAPEHLACTLESPRDDDVDWIDGLLDASCRRHRGAQQPYQAVVGEEVSPPEEPRQREDGVAAEEHRSVHLKPDLEESGADLRTRVERPESRVECADAGADQEIRLEPRPRQNVDDA